MKVFRQEARKIITAFSFLTVFPCLSSGELKGFSAYFPLVGWLMGVFLLASNWLLFSLSRLVRAFILVFLWEFASRWLHLDALADTADAFLKGGERKEILKIMSDTKLGSFGVSAILFLILGKVLFLGSLKIEDSVLVLLTAPLFARYLVTLLCFVFPAAKKEGLGSLVVSTTGFRELILATFFLLPAFWMLQFRVVITLAAVFGGFLLGFLAFRKIGGLTGDLLGALIEVTELLIVFFFLVF